MTAPTDVNTVPPGFARGAYEVWLSNGHVGTGEDFLEWIKGADAYQVWLGAGHTGTVEAFLESLRATLVDRGPWTARTAYGAGEYLSHEDALYSVSEGFTSGDTFSDEHLTVRLRAPRPDVPATVPPGFRSATATGMTQGRKVIVTWSPESVQQGVVVERRSLTDKTYGYAVTDQAAENPFAWERLNAAVLYGQTYLVDPLDLWEGETYEYRVRTFAPDGTLGTPVSAGSVKVPYWVPQNQLLHWSEDLTPPGWEAGPGVTVSAQAVTFSGATQAISQAFPTYPIGGRTYTVAFLLKGTAGQTLQIHGHAFRDGKTSDTPITLGADGAGYTRVAGTGADVGFEWFVVTRSWPAGLTGRQMRVGLNTYGSSTARSVQVRKAIVSAGAVAAAALIASYQATFGPGSTWQEPLYVYPDLLPASASPTNPTVFRSWHRSLDADVPAVTTAAGPNLAEFDGMRVESRSDLFKSVRGSNRTRIQNCTGRGLIPMKDGKTLGMAWCGDYLYQLWVLHNTFRNTRGGLTQYFWGRGQASNPDDTIKIIGNRVREVSGNYWNADGSLVPNGFFRDKNHLDGGFTRVQFFMMNGLEYGPNAQPGDALAGVEIAWNEVVGRPVFSRPEDLIHINIPGDEASPVRVHDNCMWANLPTDHANWKAFEKQGGGPYFWDYGVAADGSGDYSGTGLMPSDFLMFDKDHPARNAQHIRVTDEVRIGPRSQYALYDTQDTLYRRCRSVRSDTLYNGQLQVRTKTRGVTNWAIQITNYLKNGFMQRNGVQDCVFLTGQGELNPTAPGQPLADRPDLTFGNVFGPAVPWWAEWQELADWQARAAAAGQRIGAP